MKSRKGAQEQAPLRNATKRSKGFYTIHAVDNALKVLEIFCEESGEVSLTKISKKLNMNKSSVFRLLATFNERGYIRQSKVSGGYRLGLPAYEMGHKFLAGIGLISKCKPLMAEIAQRLREAVYLVVSDDANILLLDMVDTTQPIKVMPLVGKSFPLQTTAAGKVLLAFAPRQLAEFEGVLSAAEWDELAAVRAAGGCSDSGAFGEGIAGVAVPLLEWNGAVSGCLCVVGPHFRFTAARVGEEILPVLREVCSIMRDQVDDEDGPARSEDLGWRRPRAARERYHETIG